MTLTKKVRNLIINTAMVMVSLYLTLVVGSIFGPSILGKLLYSPEVKLIRLDKELLDVEKRAAEADGYTSIFRPEGFNYSYSLRQIAEKNSSPVIGALPYQKAYVCNEGYGLILERLDRMGFRNSDDLWDKVNEIEVMLVGDSMVFGECVHRKDSISERLIDSGLMTVSLGIGANSPAEYTLTQKIFLSAIKPNYLVMVFYPNDKSRSNGSFFFKYASKLGFAENYLVREGNSLQLSNKTKAVYKDIETLVRKRTQNESSLSFYESLGNRILSLRNPEIWRLTQFKNFITKRLNVYKAKIDSGTREAVKLATETCEKVKCIPIFVYIPNDQVFNPLKHADSYVRNLKEYSRTLGVSLIDTSQEIRSNNRAAVYSPYGLHLSPFGYELVSNAILTEIASYEENCNINVSQIPREQRCIRE